MAARTGLDRDDELASDNPEADPFSPFYSRHAESPEDGANIFQLLTYTWLDPLIWFGYRNTVEAKDAPPLSRWLRSNLLCEQTFLREWEAELGRPKPSLAIALWRSFRRTWLTGSVFRFMGDFSQVISPILLQRLIAFLTAYWTFWFIGPPTPGAPAPSTAVGFGYATGILLLQLLNSFSANQFWTFSQRSGLEVRTSLIAAVFQKCLRLSQAARTQFSAGRAINVLSTDTSRMERTLAEAQSLWASPLLVLEITIVLIINLGAPAALVGLTILVVMIPLSGSLMKFTMAYRKAANKLTDQRVKVTGELVSGIRVIKLYGWGDAMLKHLSELREEELRIIRKASLLRAFVMSIYVLQPVLASMGMFATYAALGGSMNAATILGSLAYMNVLRFPLMSLPTSISTVGDALVSLKRLQALLMADELDEKAIGHPGLGTTGTTDSVASASSPVAIVVSDATFKWESPEEAVPDLKAVKKGKLDPNDLTFSARASPNATLTASNGPRRRFFGNRGLTANPTDSLAQLEAGTSVVPLESTKATATKTELEKAKEDKFSSLRSINLSVPKGSLVCIVGPVGSGKSSLLMALAGEMKLVDGSVVYAGSSSRPTIAYCAQRAFVMNATVRENITLGTRQAYDEKRYWETVRACALQRDLEIFANGDLTEIGERGINCSGGQVQRISLARAVYSQHDVVFLDDPLSAVDAHVGKHILHEAVLGVLKGKTILMATHQLHVLPHADFVVCLDRGEIVEQGTYEELLARNGYLSKLVADYSTTSHEDDLLDEDESDSTARTDPGDDMDMFGEVEDAEDVEEGIVPATHTLGIVGGDDGTSTAGGDGSDATEVVKMSTDQGKARRRSSAPQRGLADGAPAADTFARAGTAGRKHNLEEERNTGRIPFSVYAAYVSNGGGWFLWIAIVSTMVLSQVAGIGINLWLTAWTQNRFPTYSLSQYLGVYFALGACMAALLLISGLMFAFAGMLASRGIHEKAIAKLVRAPVSFFDRTPAGRILNRFSRDVDAVDTQLVEFFRLFLLMFSIVLTTIVLIATLLPVFLAVCLPLLVVYYFVSRVARNTARELKRLDSNSRSPLYANFSETLSGLSTVRSYHLQLSFIKQNQNRLDFNNRFNWLTIQVGRWLGLRIEVMSALLVFSSSMFAVGAVAGGGSPAVLGLAVTYALGITGTLNGLMRNLTEMELQLNGVERLQYYIDHLPSEAAEVTELKPPPSWPSKGQIELKNLEMRYAPDLPLVIKGINLTIAAGERIGIVGRTGAGKSSITLALFRLVEPCGGQILIDGIDISKLGLAHLRRALSVIPQDPVVFSGTLQYNVDPFGEHSDAEILSVLETCGDLKTVVQANPLGLNMPIAEGGENLSQGQRQLLCLSRAIIRNSRIVCLDEASASLDYDSDALMQSVLREHPSFRDKTIITIAHRLQTIIDYDRICVLEQGEIAEIGTPAELVDKKDGLFRRLVDETGESADVLIKLAHAPKAARTLERT
ncbi:P-loop containing nucleoside triphosphate hydrolase protein [Hyaloraphidium curvatum]|nr:P-loop containing nucleoside triphosphate hydrolase protein [Hyaloraphidium curvatum]